MTIKMIGMVGSQPVQNSPVRTGTHPGIFREMLRDTESALGLTEASTFDRNSLKELVKEEYVKIRKEMDEKAPKIAKKLEKVRKEYFEAMFEKGPIGSIASPCPEKRIQVNTVSNMIDVPVNELVLFFLNNVKIMNERAPIEYHLGSVVFYPY